MKHLFFILLFLSCFFGSYSQDDTARIFLAKDIISKTWHGLPRFYSDKVIFLKKNLVNEDISAIRFLSKNKMCFCDSILAPRSKFSADGKETVQQPGKHCDSTTTQYQIRKNLIHIAQDGMYHYYFKFEIVPRGDLEFYVVDPEEFYKLK